MGEYVDQVPPGIQEHIRQITRTSGLPRTEGAVDMMAQRWLEKKQRFGGTIARLQMVEVDRLPRDDARGCLAMTVSGSILNIGPLRNRVRSAEYASIGIRTDVPAMATNIGSSLRGDVVIGAPVSFTRGPISGTSRVYKIAVTKEPLNLAAEQALIMEAAQTLTREFLEVNRELDFGEG